MSEFIKSIDEFCNTMDTALEFLKPEPDPRREEFSPDLPAEFRRLWEMAENWERWTAPHHAISFETMPHKVSDIANDGTISKSRCKERAERQLRKAYDAAERFLGTGKDGMGTFVLNRLNEYLTEQFHQVHHLLRLMEDIPGIQDKLDKIKELADFSRIEDAARSELGKNIGSEHQLCDFSDYAEDIQYINDDMEMEEGFLRILEKAFVHYNFDGTEAYFQIREDVQKAYDMYRDQVDWFIPQLISITYSRRVREYLTEIEIRLGTEQVAG